MNDRVALQRLAGHPRTRLAHLPTPLLQAPNLARALGDAGRDLWIKMDEYTGFGLGGNKVRKLEFELAPARLAGVTHLITSGGTQSNHARVTAAAAARLGLRCILVLNGAAPDRATGNALLQRLFGAEIRMVPHREDRAPTMEEEAAAVAREGGKALVIPLGASTPLGCLGYAAAAVELAAQLDRIQPGPGRPQRTWIFVASSSGGTLAGLFLGFSLLRRADVRLVGISADTRERDLLQHVHELAVGGRGLLGWEGELLDDMVSCTDAFVGEGYGVPTDQAREATALLGRTEGIVVDPVYTAKAAAGLIEHLRSGALPPMDRAVFLHTGGHPALLV